VYLFWKGIPWITKFLNFAGPFVYAVMIALALTIWVKAGSELTTEMGTIFEGTGDYAGSSFSAFVAIVGTMIAYFAAVVINYGDFSRNVTTQSAMKKGNLIGLPLNIAFFSLITLIVTSGVIALTGEAITSPTDIIAMVDSLPLTIVAAIMFFVATVGINIVANFIPPAYDIANLYPSKISFKLGGLITSGFALIIGGLWVSTISQLGIFGFVNTLGAVLAPIYGIMMVDYYMLKKGKLNVEELFSASEDGEYYYDNGWNKKAMIAFVVPAVFSVATVWVGSLAFLSGFSWVIGAALGGAVYFVITKK
jgi:NCS1 family nucleobase:cation symporter-1